MSQCHDVRGTDDDDNDGAVDISRDLARVVGRRYQARANGKEHDRGRVRENVRDEFSNFLSNKRRTLHTQLKAGIRVARPRRVSRGILFL